MKIIHVCLAALYREGWGYQENLLPQMHKQMGNDVVVVTTYKDSYKDFHHTQHMSSDYINVYGIRVIIVKESCRYGKLSRFGDYENLYNILEEFIPDVIFIHGGQFIAIKEIISYCKKHRSVKLYIDQHADYYNTPVKTLKQKIVQKYIYGYGIRKSIKYCNKFWGVTPWRCKYLHDVYGIPKNKIDLLVMGGDDNKIHYDQRIQVRQFIRKKLNLKEEDFVIITGGKIDKTKNIHLLMKAVIESNVENIKLIVFGVPNDDMKSDVNVSSQDSHIRYVGWIDSSDVYDYFLSSDLGVFPGTHSVLWEQACSCGLPCVFKDWEGMHHVDVGGNCVFLQDVNVNELKNVINGIYYNNLKYAKMKIIAESKGMKVFSYKNIAKKAIELQ